MHIYLFFIYIYIYSINYSWWPHCNLDIFVKFTLKSPSVKNLHLFLMFRIMHAFKQHLSDGIFQWSDVHFSLVNKQLVICMHVCMHTTSRQYCVMWTGACQIEIKLSPLIAYESYNGHTCYYILVVLLYLSMSKIFFDLVNWNFYHRFYGRFIKLTSELVNIATDVVVWYQLSRSTQQLVVVCPTRRHGTSGARWLVPARSFHLLVWGYIITENRVWLWLFWRFFCLIM